MIDGALVLFGGALLLTPGFLTDILGIAPAAAADARARARRCSCGASPAGMVAVDARPARPRRRAAAAAAAGLRRRGHGGRLAARRR